jgi:hypothetical protein
MLLRHRFTKKKLRKLRQEHENRQACKKALEKKDILIMARSLARWAMLEFRSAGREYWYPNRFTGTYKLQTVTVRVTA